jgi:protein involved in polysaccharide export with SLBB domain
MKTIFNVVIILFLSNTILSQSLGINDLKNIKVQELNEIDILKIRDEMNQKNISISTLENIAITNGMNSTDFLILKTKLENLNIKKSEINIEKETKVQEKSNTLIQDEPINDEIFGSSIFTNSSMSFEPNSNMATPAGYIIGIGDELKISINGLQEFTGNFTISKEGKITVPSVGEIFLSGLSIEAAKSQIKKSCSKVYSSIKSGESKLSLVLTKIRTVKITIIGAKKSGNYSVSSLSTVFNALHIAGGPNENGSFRKIELIRANKVIRLIDIYKFLLNGDQTDNINLQDNDIIRIPVYSSRIKIEGRVKRPGIFELLPNENFEDLLNYCSGFDESAYKSNIKLIQNTDKELRIQDLSEKDYKKYIPKSGDVFKIGNILNRFENKISIKGAVYRPDDYAFYEGMSVKDLIDKADGLTEDAYLNKALIIRLKEDLTKEIFDIDLNEIKRGKEIILKKNDELVISSLFDLKNQHTITVGGQIKKSGVYPYVSNIKLYDLIVLAGGFLDGASRNVEISRMIIKNEFSKTDKEISKIITLEIDTLLLDQTKNILLQPYDIVQIRKKPIFDKQKNISILGEVMYPGTYTLTTSEDKILDVINRAGGLKNNGDYNSIYINRKLDLNSTETKENIVKKIPISGKIIKQNMVKSRRNVLLKSGDEIIVKEKVNTVKVLGAVFLNTEIPYRSNRKLKYYVRSTGGFTELADKDKIHVIDPNGIGHTTKKILWMRFHPEITPGSEIIVPSKDQNQQKEKLNLTELVSITGMIGSLSGMTVAIVRLFDK